MRRAPPRLRPRRRTDHIVVHCSATPNSGKHTARDVVRWHTAPKKKRGGGNGWAAVGYHWIIERDGTCVPGRPIDRIGAHVRGMNATSVGICLMGGLDARKRPDPDYTREQLASLYTLVAGLRAQYPGAKLSGHREHDARKACPCFDVAGWYATGIVGP